MGGPPGRRTGLRSQPTGRSGAPLPRRILGSSVLRTEEATGMPVIEVDHLYKQYRGWVAVDDLSFTDP